MIEKDLSPPSSKTERLASLASYSIIYSGKDKDFDDIASMASAICHVPVSLITLINEKRQYSNAHIGTELKESARHLSSCTHTMADNDDIVIVPDASLDSRFADNPLLTEGNFTFYAGVPLINEDGYALGTLCVLDRESHDLKSEQVQALKALAKQIVAKLELRRKISDLEKLNQDLLSANVLIQKFASMVAHDIKNPLSSIKLTSQALKLRNEVRDNDGCLKLVDLNINATDNLLFLVDEMLAYSKNPDLLLARKQDFDLNSLITKVLSIITVPDNIKISSPEIGSPIHFSIIAIEQILINLLSNAIRYNNKANGNIQIRFAEEDDFYILEVEDNGRGIPEIYLDKIFDANFTLKIADRFNQQGSGIGLSTVKDLLRLLNSSISVKSTEGSGTTFSAMLRK